MTYPEPSLRGQDRQCWGSDCRRRRQDGQGQDQEEGQGGAPMMEGGCVSHPPLLAAHRCPHLRNARVVKACLWSELRLHGNCNQILFGCWDKPTIHPFICSFRMKPRFWEYAPVCHCPGLGGLPLLFPPVASQIYCGLNSPMWGL